MTPASEWRRVRADVPPICMSLDTVGEDKLVRNTLSSGVGMPIEESQEENDRPICLSLESILNG